MYELRSFSKPLLRGHAPIPLDPPLQTIQVPVEYRNENLGTSIFQDHPQTVPGTVTPVEDAIAEATRLVSNPSFWQLTINEYAKDGDQELRSTPHWCNSVEQVQAWLDEGAA